MIVLGMTMSRSLHALETRPLAKRTTSSKSLQAPEPHVHNTVDFRVVSCSPCLFFRARSCLSRSGIGQLLAVGGETGEAGTGSNLDHTTSDITAWEPPRHVIALSCGYCVALRGIGYQRLPAALGSSLTSAGSVVCLPLLVDRRAPMRLSDLGCAAQDTPALRGLRWMKPSSTF